MGTGTGTAARLPDSSWHWWVTALDPTCVGHTPPTAGQTLAELEPAGTGQELPDAQQQDVSLQQRQTPARARSKAERALTLTLPNLPLSTGKRCKGTLGQWHSSEPPPHRLHRTSNTTHAGSLLSSHGSVCWGRLMAASTEPQQRGVVLGSD